MYEHDLSSRIEDHARLQRHAQPFLKAIQNTDEEIAKVRLNLIKINLRPEYPLADYGRTRPPPSVIEEAYERLAKLITENESRTAELCRMVAPHAKKSCRSLCDRIYYDLPREMRDNIYGFLHGHETIYVGPEYFGQTKQPCETDRDAHYWDLEFVGEDIQREIIESWYRTTLFYFYDKHHNHEVITRFLDTDRWQLGIKPRHFICKTRFELDASQSLRTTSGIQPLENLHLLPNHVSFFIRIHTYRDVQKDPLTLKCLKRTVRDLHRSLHALRVAGHKYIVQWPDYGNLEFNRDHYDLTVEEWMGRLEAERRRML